jgi:2-amino-4-hydroxy-6-hydroxymethyldihydropteridine diphosphokinase
MALNMQQARNPNVVTVAMGGNLSNSCATPAETLRAALHKIERRSFSISAVSRFYQTPCFPAGAGDDYVNAVFLAQTCLDASGVLRVLHEVEAEFGRERAQRWGSRTLDLDLLAWNDLVTPDLATYDLWRNLSGTEQLGAAPDQLILPHPRLQDRAFVLVPMADVAPDWVHPVLNRSVDEMLTALPAAHRAEIIAL